MSIPLWDITSNKYFPLSHLLLWWIWAVLLICSCVLWWGLRVSALYVILLVHHYQTHPLSAVRIILVVSIFNCCMAWCSSFDMFDLGGGIFFMMDLISPLSSSASPCLSCWHAFSMATIYSKTGGTFGTMQSLVHELVFVLELWSMVSWISF